MTPKEKQIISGIAAIVVLVGAGNYFSKYYKAPRPTAQQEQVPQKEIDTTDWKTYKDVSHNFELKYPDSDVFLQQSNDLLRILTGAGKVVYPLVEFSFMNVGRESVFDKGTNVALGATSFADKSALIYVCGDLNQCPPQPPYSVAIRLLEYPVSWGANNEIDIIPSRVDRYYTVANQILSTFKFTK